jgi:hypothetical protein
MMRARPYAELDDPTAAWFTPALERLRTLAADPDERVRRFFADDAPIFIGRAPGRLDVMGGIADYSGALVLELPLDRATFALVQRQDAARCDVVTPKPWPRGSPVAMMRGRRTWPASCSSARAAPPRSTSRDSPAFASSSSRPCRWDEASARRRRWRSRP